MKKQRYSTNNPAQTRKLGEKLAKEILRKKTGKKAFIVGLEGDLGSGKTTFLQGFAKGLSIKEKVLSPTFVIMKKFAIKTNTQHPTPNTLYHIDCYRLKKPKELLGLGFKEIVSNPRNIIAIEWVDKIDKIILRETISISFKFINKNKREISFTPLEILRMKSTRKKVVKSRKTFP